MPMIIFVVAIAAVALGGAMYYRTSTEATTAANGSAETETTTNTGIADMLDDARGAAESMEAGMGGDTTPNDEPDSEYADGTYTKTGTYTSPAGAETVTVSVTLTDDIVTSATFTGNATNPSSINNQGKFAAGYNALVVGKSLDAIELTVVNGSSLTSGGFMEALDLIKADAKL